MTTSLAFAILCAVAPAAPAAAGTVAGTLPERGVVWVTDRKPPAAMSVEMRNTHKSFVPDLVTVPVGSTVRFPNDDSFYHSIYSVSEADPFDIGFYLTGPGKDVTFAQPGIIDVRCHIHVFMRATIVVVDGAFVQSDGGQFTLRDVAPGDRIVHTWTAANGIRTMTVRVPRDGTVSIPAP